ncbi:hypothetical protein [Salana multivorans]
MLHRILTAVIAAASLAGGFALNQATGSRWLGAAVIVAGAAWCVVRSWRTTSLWRLAVVVLLGAACLPVSHRLAPEIGAWPSVALTSAALALGVVAGVDDRVARRAGSRAAQTTP